jgi:hypothetical protein
MLQRVNPTDRPYFFFQQVTVTHFFFGLTSIHFIDCLLLLCKINALLENLSLKLGRHHWRWRAAKFRSMFGAQGLWAGRDLYRATPAVTRDLGFSRLIRSSVPFLRLWRHARDADRKSHRPPLWHEWGCWGPTLTRIIKGINSVNQNINLVEILVRTQKKKKQHPNSKFSTVSPRYNGHVCLQWFCRNNEFAVVTNYRHYQSISW